MENRSDAIDIAALVNVIVEIERRLAANRIDDGKALMRPFLPDGTAGTLFSAYGGLAFLYDSLAAGNRAPQFQQKRLEYGQSALLLNPTDALAHAVLSENECLLVAENLLRHQQLPMATQLLTYLQDHSESDSAGFRLDLIAYFERERRQILECAPAAVSDPRPLLINVNVWGTAYVQTLFQYGFASLLAPENLPKRALERKIFIDIYTTREDKQRITDHPMTGTLSELAEIRYRLLPETSLTAPVRQVLPEVDLWCLAGAQQSGALRARRLGADLIYCGPAFVYSANALNALSRYLADGHKAVLSIIPRTRESTAHAQLRTYGEVEAHKIDIGEDALAKFVAENLHEQSINCFLGSDEKLVEQNPVTLFFPIDEGFACRSYQPFPVIVSNELLPDDFTFDTFPADARFLAQAIQEREPGAAVKFVTDPAQEIVVTDVDCDAGSGMKTYGAIAATAENCVSGALHTSILETDLDYYRWSLRQRVEYKVGDPSLLPTADESEASVMQRIDALFEAGSAGALDRLRFFRRLTAKTS
ncbi:MAG: hypothetical protein GKS00_00240 [Alphaproteobacteria bacterium]|nr:hypothetical protein [Alphaproteobacteria bacterium]